MPTKDAAFWQAELQQAHKHEDKWRKRAKRVIEIYSDARMREDTHFNILWSNTQTQRPALYSATPKPVVKRRHRQQGEAGRLVALLLERCLSYANDPGGSYDFDRIGAKLILDYLLPGRMVARVRYHPIIYQNTREIVADVPPDNALEVRTDDEGRFLFEEKYDELVDEEVRCYHIPYDQYRQSVADHWEDVWWVAYGNNYLTVEEVVEQFGEEHANVPLKHMAHVEDETNPDKSMERDIKKARVWEIWDRDERKVYAVIEGYDKLLMEKEDPLRLRGFFPQPEPALIVESPNTLIPVPEYTLYQCQAEELNLITMRIENLVKAMKLSGVYPGSQKGVIKELLDSKENVLVPVEDWGAITERGGLSGMIEWLPLRDVADAWQRLMVYRSTLIQNIFELTGISDIQRGATDPRETKGAQQLKAGFATRRLLPKQQETQRFFRDLFRIQAEVIAEHFQTETVAKMAQQPVTQQLEQAREILRDDALRSFAVDIETDSTIAADEQLDKQGVAEFTAAMSQFLGQIFPIVQVQPAAVTPLGKMMLWMARKFRIARDAEDELEEFLQSFQQLPDNQANAQQQALQAQQQAEKAKMQMESQAKQAELAIKQAESQAEIQRKAQETQLQMQLEREKANLERRKMLLDIAEKESKIRLMQEEAEAKVVLAAVDQQAKRATERSRQTESKESASGKTDVKVDVGEKPKPKRIKLVKDDNNRVTGAEVRPADDVRRVEFNRDESDRITSADID